jgi:hypothetical protein
MSFSKGFMDRKFIERRIWLLALGLALDSLLASADCGKYSHFVEEKTGA